MYWCTQGDCATDEFEPCTEAGRNFCTPRDCEFCNTYSEDAELVDDEDEAQNMGVMSKKVPNEQ